MQDLRILLIEITQKCNANCLQCGSRCDIHSKENLTKQDILKALKDVKDNIGTDVMINISGGEPLMRKDLFDIMFEIDKMGFDWGMVSNGTLITDKVIENMKNTHMKTITISLDGMKYTHEELRQLPNSFNKIVSNIIKLKQANFLDHLQVTFTANKRNVYEINQLYKLLNNIGIDSIRVSFIDPIGRAEDNKDLLLAKQEMEWLINFANEKNKGKGIPIVWGCPHYLGDKLNNRNFKCFTGQTSASILYNGDIFVCPNVPRFPELIQGNIKVDSFSKIWNTKFKQFRWNKHIDKCIGCKYKNKCDGDSWHTFDFENNTPKFCYKEIFETDTQKYLKYIKDTYKNGIIEEIKSPDDGVDTLYIEPEAYQEIKSYFHFGKEQPLSMYEQQMGLLGYKLDNDYIIRYVFPSYIDRLANDYARFNKETLKQVTNELMIASRNISNSSDKNKPTFGELKFLGFIHSHPIQKELQYSTGDVKIHKKMTKLFGDYIGILTNPSTEAIGAYYKKEMKQINMILIEGV